MNLTTTPFTLTALCEVYHAGASVTVANVLDLSAVAVCAFLAAGQSRQIPLSTVRNRAAAVSQMFHQGQVKHLALRFLLSVRWSAAILTLS